MSNPQQIGSAISYARRYSIQSILNLNTNDDDGNLASHGNAPVVQVEPKKEKLTLKSQKWKDVEQKVIEMLSDGISTEDIIKRASAHYEIGKDVINFIKDNGSN